MPIPECTKYDNHFTDLEDRFDFLKGIKGPLFKREGVRGVKKWPIL
jgi:hypothetical protein